MLPISDVCKLDELVSLKNDICDVKQENTGRDSILGKQWLTSDHTTMLINLCNKQIILLMAFKAHC